MKYLNQTNLHKLKNNSRRYPPRELLLKIMERLRSPYRDYPAVSGRYLPDEETLHKQRKKHWQETPLVSIVVPAYETKEIFLKEMIDSVRAQTYEHWELCIADGSRSDAVREILNRDYAQETRIKYQKLCQNGGIAKNTNQGFEMAEGAYIALLDHDDVLVPSALYEMIKRIEETGADLLYSDEDHMDAPQNGYFNPHFKLGFNRELLLGMNYICHFLMVSADLLKQAGGMDEAYEGAQDYELLLRLSCHAKRVEHIPKILYHWRLHASSTASATDSKPYAYEAGRRAVEAYIRREGWKAEVTMDADLGSHHIRYRVPQDLALIVYAWGEPSRNWKELKIQLMHELSQAGIRQIFWNEEYGQLPPKQYVCVQSAPRCAMLLISRSAKSICPQSASILLGSLSRPGIAIVGGKTFSKGKVVQCGYWKRETGFLARYQGLSTGFKGYYNRASLAVETDAVTNELAAADLRTFEQLYGQGVETFLAKNGQLQNLQQWQALCCQVKAGGGRIIVDPAAQLKR